MTTTPEMKPCPWCNSSDLYIDTAWSSGSFVYCQTCFCQGPKAYVRGSEERERLAVELWNTRCGEHEAKGGSDE